MRLTANCFVLANKCFQRLHFETRRVVCARLYCDRPSQSDQQSHTRVFEDLKKKQRSNRPKIVRPGLKQDFNPPVSSSTALGRKPKDKSNNSMGAKKKDKRQAVSHGDSMSYLQVLGTGTDIGGDGLASVLLFFDHARMLFNVGEGTQKLFAEHKVRLVRTRYVFMTRVSTKSAGGLLGTLLTLADLGTTEEPVKLTVHGPQGLAQLAVAMELQAGYGRNISVEYNDFGLAGAESPAAPAIEDDRVTLTPITLCPELSSVAEPAGVEEAKNGAEVEAPAAKRQRVAEADGTANALPAEASATEVDDDGGLAVCYLGRLADIPGKFDPAKAMERGVPRGPLWGKIQRGETVQSDQGWDVRPSDVMEPASPGPVFLVLDCPTLRHLPALRRAPSLAPFLAGADGDSAGAGGSALTVVVHLSPACVVEAPEYVAWMQSLGGTPAHILVNGTACDYSPTVFPTADTLQVLPAMRPALLRLVLPTADTLQVLPAMHSALLPRVVPTA
ncbi:tRNAse Z trz4, mitochondrial, partial [Cymbomonas tetramitiformis]